ncbi:MAG: site-specific DNA-methyltransferase [Ignavibacteria bacterium]|nr:site-specific DNA-methyltransferase [Ignavibacteria bacterium]
MIEKFINKVILGDCLDVLEKIPNDSVHLIVTSPPYNLNIQYENHSDELEYSDYLKWMSEVWKKCNEVLVRGGRLCINIGENKRQNISYPTYSAFIQSCVELNMLYRGTIIWNKNSAAKHTAWGSWNSPSNPHIVPRHEYIIIFSKGDYKLLGKKENCDLKPEEFMEYTRSVWSFGTESKTKIGHPAPFPLELPKRLIKFYSYKEQIVLDPFAGSGTVGIAASLLERNYILIDNSEEYCKLAEKRINDKNGMNLFNVSNKKDFIDSSAEIQILNN